MLQKRRERPEQTKTCLKITFVNLLKKPRKNRPKSRFFLNLEKKSKKVKKVLTKVLIFDFLAFANHRREDLPPGLPAEISQFEYEMRWESRNFSFPFATANGRELRDFESADDW